MHAAPESLPQGKDLSSSRSARLAFWGWVCFAVFILTIPLGNWVVMNVGLVCPPNSPCLIPVWPGVMSPSAVLLAGLALVVRDGVHHALGWKWTIAAILLGAALSGFLSEPGLILASTVAFLFSEVADFLVYAPLRRNYPAWAVIASGLAGSVVDSFLFLTIAFGSTEYLFGQVLGKFWMSLAVGVLIGVVRFARRAPREAAA